MSNMPIQIGTGVNTNKKVGKIELATGANTHKSQGKVLLATGANTEKTKYSKTAAVASKIYAIGIWRKNNANTYGFFEINGATGVIRLIREHASYASSTSLVSHAGRLYGLRRSGNYVRRFLYNVAFDGMSVRGDGYFFKPRRP